jgi:hypothetical protein
LTCRSGCKTKDHGSYAECLRAASIQMPAVLTSPMSDMYGKTKRDLSAYENARQSGIQPGGTTVEKVREAEAASRVLGRPYNADTDPPANMIQTKTAAKFVNWKE